MVVPAAVPPSPRYLGLDALRAGAMLLGVVYHAAYAWVPDIGPWYFVADESPVEALIPLTHFLHAFRMQLFFALSGFFSHLVWERRGSEGFLPERARRLLKPYALALPGVIGVDWALRGWVHARGLMSDAFALGAQMHWSPLHLWFLSYLFGYCLIARWISWPSLLRASQRAFRRPWLLLLLAVPTVTALWLHPDLRPDEPFWPQPFEFFHFGLFFAFGWLAWAARTTLEPLQRQAPWFLSTGLLVGAYFATGGRQWSNFGQQSVGIVSWLMTLGLFGIAARTATAQPRWLPFLVAASYWVYVAHYSVIEMLQAALRSVTWPGALEYLFTVALCLTLCLGSYAGWSRLRQNFR